MSGAQEMNQFDESIAIRKGELRRYFERIAPEWERWYRANLFYHDSISRLVTGIVPPGQDVLELGTGYGEILSALAPRRGVGLNVAEELTREAARRNPGLEFSTVDVDEVALPEGFRPAYVVMANMLDYVCDIWSVLREVKARSADETTLIVTSSNPIWQPLLRAASFCGLRFPESPRNFITNRDLFNVLELHGFEIVHEGLLLPLPKKVPVVGDLVNLLVPEIPLLRYCSSVQYLVARSCAPRRPLSCSVVIPCHNEEGNIVECLDRVPEFGARREIVVVDDGSKDATRQRVMDAIERDPSIRLIAFDRNRGKANAVRAGFEAASGDVLMILDADMTVMPEELPRFFEAIQKGQADFVNGTRLVYPMMGKAMRTVNFFGNKIFCLLVSWVIGQRISDSLCGTKVLLKRDYLRMPSSGADRWGDFDLLFGAARLQLRLREIPVRYQERKAGKSKMRALKDGLLFLKTCFRGWKMLRLPASHPWSEHAALEGAGEPVAEMHGRANLGDGT